jgi:DNA-binding NarL/FixJ family response regulator
VLLVNGRSAVRIRSLLKDTPPADLLAAIPVVAAGDALLAPGITRRLIEEFTRHPSPRRARQPRWTT